MNERQAELIETLFRNGTYESRFAKRGVPEWLMDSEGDTVSEKVWLHFHARPLCACGKKTRFLNYAMGYRKSCSARCAQKLLAPQKSAMQEAKWADEGYREKTAKRMREAHHTNRSQAKLDKLLVKGITALEEIVPGMQNTYKWKHVCGEVFERPFTRVTGIWCPMCHVSSGQGELYEAIRERYTGRILVNDRQAIKPKEIDIYLPEIGLGFEYHGEYWHPGDGTREAAKVIKAAEVGIRIEEFWEVHWKHKKREQLARLDRLLTTL